MPGLSDFQEVGCTIPNLMQSIFKLKYYSLPNRELSYDIVVNSNVRFDKNESSFEVRNRWGWVDSNQGGRDYGY